MKSTLLDKSFRILDCIAAAGRPVTLKELAADLELNTSTVSRIASDLAERNLICKEGYHSFVPAVGLIRLGQAAIAGSPLVRKAGEIILKDCSKLNVSGVFAGIDNDNLVYLFRHDAVREGETPLRFPLWKSHLAAVILGRGGNWQAAERFFYSSIRHEAENLDVSRELQLFNRRCRQAEKDGFVIFRDPRWGWSINFPVPVDEKIYGVALFGGNTSECNEKMHFSCQRLASRLRSQLA